MITTSNDDLRSNIWVIYEDRFVAVRIEDALRRRGVENSSCQFVSATELSQLEGTDGVYLLCVDEITPNELDLAARIRGMVGTEPALVAVTNPMQNEVLLRAVRAGISDFLFFDDRFDAEVNQLFTRMSLNLRNRNRHGRIVSVVPCLSAIDANVISVNLASIVAEQVGICGLLDFQLRGSCQSLLLNVDPCHTMADLLSVGDAIDESMFLKAVTLHDSGIRLLAGPTSLLNLGELQPRASQKILDLARSCWPVSIVNCEDVQHADQVRILGHSDDVVLCTRMDIASLNCAQRILDWLIQSHVPKDHIHIIALETCHDGPLNATDAKTLLKNSPVSVIEEDSELSVRSINLGNPLVRECPNTRMAAAIRKFTNDVMGLGNTVVPKRSVSSMLKVGVVTFSSFFAMKS